MYIEIPLLLLFFALMVSDSVTTNLLIFRTCYITLGYNKTECALLGSGSTDNQTANLEKLVEPYSTVITMTISLSESVFTSITCLFVGPWSDKFGRKPMLVIPIFGFAFHYLLRMVWAFWDTLSPWYSLVCLAPVYVTGGIPSFLTVVLGSVSDLTNENNRGMRMGILDGFLFMGGFLGTLSSSYIFAATNYGVVYLVSSVCCFLGFVMVVFWVPESLPNAQSQGRLNGLFRISNIKSMVLTTVKPRPDYKRFCIFCCLLMMSLFILIMNGNGSLTFLYLREHFQWSLQKYTQYSAASSMVTIFGTVFGIYCLHKLLKIPESIMILAAAISSVNGALLMGLAKSDWIILYAVPVAKLLGGVTGPMIRSFVSKLVEKEEVGKVLALLTSCEFFVGMAGSPLYTFIYNKTIDTNPGLYNFVTAGIYSLEVLIIIAVIGVRTIQKGRSDRNYAINEDEGVSEDDVPLLDDGDKNVIVEG